MFFLAGGRTTKDIIKWLEKKGGADIPPKEMTQFKEADAAKEWADKAKGSDPDKEPVVAFLGIFKDLEGEEAKNFLEVARGDLEDHAEFALASGEAFLKEFGVDDSEDAVMAFKPWDDKTAVLEKNFRVAKIELMVYKNLYPNLAVLSA